MALLLLTMVVKRFYAVCRYTSFHTTALCSPTRAALLTGRNHHSVHSGTITESATGYPGYDTLIPKDSVALGEVNEAQLLDDVLIAMNVNFISLWWQ